jgi:hypothetical protein
MLQVLHDLIKVPHDMINDMVNVPHYIVKVYVNMLIVSLYTEHVSTGMVKGPSAHGKMYGKVSQDMIYEYQHLVNVFMDMVKVYVDIINVIRDMIQQSKDMVLVF